MQPAPPGVTLFRTVRKISSGTDLILTPTGFQTTASPITASRVIGLIFTSQGFSVYNPTVGTGVLATYTYPNNASYPTLFDLVRIVKVEVQGFYGFTVATAAANPIMPVFYSCVDYDTDTNPTTTAAVLAYDNSKYHQANSTGMPFVNEQFSPRVLNSLGVGGSNTVMPPGTWIDSASSNTPHYGMFCAVEGTLTSASGTINLITTIHYEWAANR
jgi:hypothetical protein